MALITGSPEAPVLVSTGWRRFVESKLPKAAGKPQAPMPSPVTKTEITFADFDLKVDQLDSQSCRVSVLDSPAGQDSVNCTLPFDLNHVGDLMLDLGRQVGRGDVSRVPSQVTPVMIGEMLFKSIFAGAVGQLFFESLGEAQSRSKGLRIRIHVDPENSPGLAALPWEYLYNDRRRRFLSLNRMSPVIRYLDVQAPTTRPAISLPLRVLVAIASPGELPPLDLNREREYIQAAWGNRPDVWVDYLDPATPSALQAQLWDWQPHVLHFMGHGHFDAETGSGALLFVNEQRHMQPVTGTQLGVLLSNTPSVQLVFLNACQSAELTRARGLDPFSGVAAALVMAGMPAVVAMQFPVSDKAAVIFANKFYPRLAAGDPIEVAVAFGREALQLELSDSHEWGTPVLFMRVSDGRLFRTQESE